MSSVSPARALAFATLRATFEENAFTERAFRAAADQSDLDGRGRAQAQRLAYGSVQRRGTSDVAIERLAGRSTRLLDPPVLAALRLGLYELLFADGTPDHAAVDQAVELTKGAGAAHASGLVNAVLRRAGRERSQLTAALLEDDSTPAAAAVADSAPQWLAEMWWEELGPEAARAALAACNQRAEVAMRVNSLRGEREALLARLTEGGVDACLPEADWPLAAGETIVVAGRMGDAVSAAIVAGELTPQSRGSAAVVELLDPQEGDHVLDLCAGPGIKTGQIAERMGDRGEVISVELDPARAVEVAAQATRLGLRSVTVIEADATAGPARTRFRPGAAGRSLLGPRHPRLPPRRPLAQVAEDDRAADRDSGRAPAQRRGGPASRRHPGLLDLHDLPPRERGADRRPAARLRGGRDAAAGARRPRRPGAAARLRGRAALPATAPRSGPHHRLLRRPA